MCHLSGNVSVLIMMTFVLCACAIPCMHFVSVCVCMPVLCARMCLAGVVHACMCIYCMYNIFLCTNICFFARECSYILIIYVCVYTELYQSAEVERRKQEISEYNKV